MCSVPSSSLGSSALLRRHARITALHTGLLPSAWVLNLLSRLWPQARSLLGTLLCLISLGNRDLSLLYNRYKPYATTSDYKVSAPMQGFTPKPLHLTTMKSESFQSSTTRTSFSKSRTSLTKSDYSATLRPTPTTPDFKGEEIPLTPSTPSTVYHALTLDNHDIEAQKHVSS